MIKVIFFDFDGVILDSMSIRDIGFEKIAREATDSGEIINDFLSYHRYNAGLSRYVKIRYLYEEMLNIKISEEEINKIANNFSSLMREKLVNKDYLIKETIKFIEENHKKYIMHIVSGSDEKELNYLCKELEINQYFKTIEGSPTHKNDLVKNILEIYNYDNDTCVLIGDSVTDLNAAKINNLVFYGYNNEKLKGNDKYINTFKNFILNI